MIDTIAVSTDDPAGEIIAAQNSAAWSVNVRRWSGQLKYLLCVRRTGSEREAFLICKNLRFVQDLEATNRSKGGRPKFAVEFESYAVTDSPVEWKKSQNPVRFGNLLQFIGRDAVPSVFKSVTPKTSDAPRFSYSWKMADQPAVSGLSIAEAKRGLAVRYGVPQDAVTITIQA